MMTTRSFTPFTQAQPARPMPPGGYPDSSRYDTAPFAAARASAGAVRSAFSGDWFTREFGGHFDVAVVLGSGLGSFIDTLEGRASVSADAAGFPVSTVPGHAGRIIAGLLPSDERPPVRVLALASRVHLYEGWSAHAVAHQVRVASALGINRVVLTNAAGGIDPTYAVGELVAISDHINATNHNPLAGPLDHPDSRFVDMSDCYAVSRRLADRDGLARGVYAQMLGPSYETPAEIDALASMGASLAGMSTAGEAIAARHLGMAVCGLSLVTNLAAGRGGELSHEEVAREGASASDRFCALVKRVCCDETLWQ